MEQKSIEDAAEFYVFSSYGIPERLYFVLLGSIKSGHIRDNMYAKITMNSTLTLSVKINEVTKIEYAGDKSVDTLLITYCEDKEWYDNLLAMNVYSETVKIEIEGAD
jgi:hypothetical protein